MRLWGRGIECSCTTFNVYDVEVSSGFKFYSSSLDFGVIFSIKGVEVKLCIFITAIP